MANKGKRMVNEDLIKQIGQGGGGTTYTAGDGISISAEDVISVDNTVALKSDLATVATTGDYDDLTNKPTIPSYTAGTGIDIIKNNIRVDSTIVATKLDLSIKRVPNPVLVGPSANDQATITAWLKKLPILVGRNNFIYSTLYNLGFTNIVMAPDVGMTVELQGYFACAVESGTSPYNLEKIVVCTCENRTGTNTLVNRSCTYRMTAFKSSSQEWTGNDFRYRGMNTSLSEGVDPVSLQALEVYSVASTPAKKFTMALRNDRNFIKEYWFMWKVNNPTETDYSGQLLAPTTEGTYKLTVTVDANGSPTYAWVAEV